MFFPGQKIEIFLKKSPLNKKLHLKGKVVSTSNGVELNMNENFVFIPYENILMIERVSP